MLHRTNLVVLLLSLALTACGGGSTSGPSGGGSSATVDTLKVLDESPEKLTQVTGLGERRADEIIAALSH